MNIYNYTKQVLDNANNDMFTSISFKGKILKFNFKDNEYTPITICVSDKEDITNLNIVFNYLMNGAKITSKMNEDPEVDVEYEVDMCDDEHIYKFDLGNFLSPDQETEGYEDFEKDPLVAPHLRRILEHANFVYNFTNTYTKDAYHNESFKYNDHLEVKYELDFDTGDYSIIIKTVK